MNLPSIQTLIGRGALFVVNHSAGKDSQAMFIKLRAMIPPHQLLVVHAVLPDVEWGGVIEHIQATVGETPTIFAKAPKTFFEMVEKNGRFPIAGNRQCTSDLKRDPIERELRRYLRNHPEFGGLIVQCFGIRAAESASRRRQVPFTHYSRGSKAGREWFHWKPIFDLSEAEVFSTIAGAGEKPHWAYRAGMTRLSCCFCIMASRQDLTTAARLNPSLYRRYVETERRLGFTLSMSRQPLPHTTGIAA
ncbi:phosphoadenosine phosphosulfate reductase family protein [Sphingomonas sp. MG17]|uniref:Phosphoadenosine phosphosulfate reductase family protein n=1 Tax=Sphingomonas tagetis TaxID=2949092 RepID=A0A9X2HHJ8_9SPHN|nr:phosphoadenosine phosphosulfate reductase family protein [Sphingomonas tagetis]MCP3729299.1 phosphoadenosine phosphosulfate reductase family protein [Sphingomonas tagetis]